MEAKQKQLSNIKIDIIKKSDLKMIFQTLMVVPSKRTIADLSTISKIIINITPMKDMKDLSAIFNICKAMYIIKFKEKDFVYQKKEDSQALYIVLNGKIGLYQKSGQDYQASDEVILMSPGYCFGQMYDWKYKLLPLALQETLVAILPHKQLCKLPIQMAIEKERIVRELKATGIFSRNKNSHLSNADIHEASQLCCINRVPHGTILIQDGQIPKALFYVLKGMVKKICQVKYQNTYKALQICRYCTGDYFPQNELSQSINYSLITECPSQIITIPKKALKKLGYPLKPNLQGKIKDQNFYLEEIQKMKEWQQYKKQLLFQIFDDINKKKQNK